MVADAALNHDPDLIEAAVVAVRFSMENALLLEAVQARLADLQAASARIIQAGALERRRIQQDLHDGIQGRLNALAPRLGAVKATTTDQHAAAHIADIRDALAQALTDLRKLAAGIRPDVLNLGLKAAVTDICRPYQPGLPVRPGLITQAVEAGRITRGRQDRAEWPGTLRPAELAGPK
jgi:signal transduction histidine kinase